MENGCVMYYVRGRSHDLGVKIVVCENSYCFQKDGGELCFSCLDVFWQPERDRGW